MMFLRQVDPDVTAQRIVVVDGRDVGVVRQRMVGGHLRWVAQVQIAEDRALPSVALATITGSGETPEQAVKNACHVYRAAHRQALELIDALDARMRGAAW